LRRYVVLAASLLVQVCLGGIYAWSAFVPELVQRYRLSVFESQFVFGAQIAVFALAMIPAGRYLERRGPTFLLAISGGLFFVGYLLASLSHGSFTLLVIGISVTVGVAIGFGYVCPLSVCMRWFPSQKGLVTGIAVAGFGAGAILLATVTERLMLHGMDVLTIFRFVGVVYGATILGGSLLIVFPPVSDRRQVPNRVPMSTRDVLRDVFFWLLIIGMFCATFAGLLIIGNLKSTALSWGFSAGTATLGISVFAVGNASGRIVWGGIADRLKMTTVYLSLAVLASSILVLLWSHTAFIFLGATFLVGFGFGASFVVYAAMVAYRFGAQRFPSIYPLVFLAYGFAGIVGPSVGGWLNDITGAATAPLVVSAAIVASGLVAIGAIRRWGLRTSS